jgi:hypothetical protein
MYQEPFKRIFIFVRVADERLMSHTVARISPNRESNVSRKKRFGHRCRTVLKSALTQFWCNPGQADSQGLTHHVDDLTLSLALPCLRGASLEERLGQDSTLAASMPAIPATGVRPEDHRNALNMKVLQKELMIIEQAQTGQMSRKCTKIASEPN